MLIFVLYFLEKSQRPTTHKSSRHVQVIKLQEKRYVHNTSIDVIINAQRFSSPTFRKSSICHKANPINTLPFTRLKMHLTPYTTLFSSSGQNFGFPRGITISYILLFPPSS